MRGSTRQPTLVAPPRRVFLGRDAPLLALREALREHAPTGRFIAVAGEAGIGKTSLIDAALAAADGPAGVLRATADAMDRRRSYRLLLDAVAPALGPQDGGLVDEQSEYTTGERLHAVLDRVTVTPTVLVLEDLHWADPASLGLLARLAQTLEQVPLLIIGSLRTQARHETAPGLDRLLSVLSERGLLDTIELGPLAEQACLAITERLTGGHVAGVLAEHIAAAGGNPLFLTEMIRALLRDHAVRIDTRGEALLDAPMGPSPSLAMVIMRHLSHLSAPTREMLSTAALLGTRFPAVDLRAAAGRPMSELVPMLRESLAAGILAEVTADLLGFRHELLQAVLLRDLPATVGAELHREIALRLDAAQVAPATVAEHLLRATSAVADLPWMLRLAERAAPAAPAIAIQLWERVVDATDVDDPLRARANAALAFAALREGRIGEAVSIAETALRGDVPPEAVPALATIRTHALMLSHRHAESRDAAEAYAESDALTPAERALHRAFAGWPRFMLGDVDGAHDAARKAAALAAEVDSCGARVYALTLQGQIANCRGDLDEALAALTEAVATADRHPCLAGIESFPHAQLAVALADVDRRDEVVPMLHRGLRAAEDFGYRTGALANHSLGALALSGAGNLSDVAAELDAHRSLIGLMDVRLDLPVRGLWAHVLSHQQGLQASAEWAARLDPVPGHDYWAGRGRSWIWLGRSQIERSGGDGAGVFGVLWDGWTEFRATQLIMDCAEIGLELVLAARDAAVPGELTAERVDEIVEVTRDLADRNPSVGQLRAKALAIQGVVGGDPDALAEAARLFATTGRCLEHARAAELAALALPVHDAAARRLAEAALGAYAEAGADHDASRARAAFRRRGVRLLAPPRVRPATGWESLTRTETRIALHLAVGETNPEIAQSLCVSRRTVESHVSQILVKLGLRSRTEVAIFVARRGEQLGQHGQ